MVICIWSVLEVRSKMHSRLFPRSRTDTELVPRYSDNGICAMCTLDRVQDPSRAHSTSRAVPSLRQHARLVDLQYGSTVPHRPSISQHVSLKSTASNPTKRSNASQSERAFPNSFTRIQPHPILTSIGSDRVRLMQSK